ncbi:YDG/SRA domain-containing protein [Saccharomonospora iraqiensis]|uniref:YDG/SRA domain-containing protein n=1 Tax=Saccharomonospora iraqiensis TaxID=52698 RepID=UPI0004214DDA|nr:YDG/SRA domain-containing protein [Saccharomonospora iraqiensis]
MAQREYGEIPGYPEGTLFANRQELRLAGLHSPNQGGISGGKDGADSIVVSGGYPDDEDHGDVIIYTGQGGRDPSTGRQINDQKLVQGNIGLVRSQLDQRPVRVIRGAGGNPDYSPERGYRYDGLFRVVNYWHAVGLDGYRIWRFRLEKLNKTVEQALKKAVPAHTRRVDYISSRIVRDRSAVDRVKELHDFTCQVCGLRLTTAGGPYAEAAHIRALGRPHEGPDHETNMLCLCPNHHVLFDNGAIFVDEEGDVWDALSGTRMNPLRTVREHHIDPEYLRYHREHTATP